MKCPNCQALINDQSTVCPCCLGGVTVPCPCIERNDRLRAECKAWRDHFQNGTRLELGVKPACKAVDDHHDLG